MYEHEATVIEGVDFAIILGEQPPSGYPGNILDTPEANTALKAAYIWASELVNKFESKPASKSNRWPAAAANAKVYIEAIPMNREYDPSKDTADKTQLLYVLSNLTYWRGDIARASKVVLNDYVQSLNSRY
jgi:hypothetical protein